MYSSGTTGVPKCIVHGVGGTLLQHRKEHLLHVDLHPEDRLFFFTTCGWMMWNWLVSGLASSATLILYEGSPFHPGPEVLWRMAAQERVTIFGTSPKYLAALEKDGYRPRDQVDLSPLRTVLSTGSPLAPEQFDFVYDAIKSDLQLASISGGTDILSCFCIGNPWQSVHRGELQCRGLGMAVAIFDEAGHPVVGQPGELVCTAAFPSVPIGFWNDPDGRRFHEAYFARYPNVWHHGDFAELTARGTVIITGRSDAVLNPGGVRIGTAEIYRQAERLPEILESIAVGQDWDRDVRVVLFVRLRPGITLDAALEKRIRDVIRTNTTPRHVPAKILAVADIPRTISGKTVELAVRNVIHGRPVKNTDALANPGALEYFRDRPELRS
jgi:acetoacetyl-CoA synthetase